MKLALMVTLLTCGATAQTFVMPQEQELLVARTAQASIEAFTAAGARMSVEGIRFSSSDPNIAAVTEAGEIRGMRPGMTAITAQSSAGTILGSTVVRVYPLEIQLEPATVEVRMGESAAISAKVLDADFRTIENVALVYESSNTAVASLQGNTIQPASPGNCTFTVRIQGVPATGKYAAVGQIRVLARKAYRVERMTPASSASSGTMEVFRSLSVSGNVVGSIVTLSNGGQAAVVREGNTWRSVAHAGQYFRALNRPISRLFDISVNARGDVLLHVDTPGNWCAQQLLLIPKVGAPIRVASACSLRISAQSLGEDGSAMFMTNERSNRILRRSAAGEVAEVFNGSVSTPAITSIHWIAFTRTGAAVFRATAQTGAVAVYSLEGSTLTRILSPTDSIGAQALNGFDEGFAGQDGSVMARWYALNRSGVLRLYPGPPTILFTSGVELGGRQLNWFHSGYDARNGELLASVDLAGAGSNLVALSSTGVSILSPTKTWNGLADSRFFGSGAIGYGIGANDTRPSLRGYRGAQIDASGAIAAPPAVDWRLLSRGNDGSKILTLGAGESLIEAGVAGWRALATPGSSTAGATVLSSIMTAVGNRSGQAYFSARGGGSDLLVAYRNQKLEIVASSGGGPLSGGRKLTWIWGHRQRYLSVNARGELAGLAGWDSTDCVAILPATLANGQIALCRGQTAPGGGPYSPSDQVELDDLGRAYFLNQDRSVLYGGLPGSLARLLTAGDLIRGRVIRSVSAISAAGSFLNAIIETSQGRVVARWDGAAWTELATERENNLEGFLLTEYYLSQLASSASGHVALVGRVNELGLSVVVINPSGELRRVASSNESIDGSNWLIEPQSVSISDKGEVFFSAWTISDSGQSLGIYRAVPIH